nr:phospholipase-like protein [Tanacetum cinerariifolium]
IRLCLLLSLEVIFMGRELVSVIDDAFLRMVNYLDAWNSFPWVEYIWRQLYDSIKNVCSKHKLEHLDGLRKNPNHVPSYTSFGFLFDFKSLLVNRIVGGPECQKSSPNQCHGPEQLNVLSESISPSFLTRLMSMFVDTSKRD